MRSRFLLSSGAILLLAALAAPASADPVYSWRTEDGGYAFTDDPKAIPARYRDQAKQREAGRLGDYQRYTPSDDAAAERYAEQLDRRLAYLRSVNARPVARRDDAMVAGGTGSTASLSMQSANSYEPSVEISQNMSSEPIVVDTLFTRPEGKAVTRQTQVVRQGDQILSILRPRLREWSVTTDIHDESEFDLPY
ncbi:MAG TPA: DUF4124 domain-containing protein [Myxococcota bacterium]|jgi:hypothetical protein